MQQEFKQFHFVFRFAAYNLHTIIAQFCCLCRILNTRDSENGDEPNDVIY